MSEVRKNVNVILVGSNPLPCYIQAAYVMREGERTQKEMEAGLVKPDIVLFVATKETDIFIDYIIEVLSKNVASFSEYKFKRIIIDDIYDSAGIERKTKEELEDINKNPDTRIGKILLNNTGGTKAMAVYATAGIRGLSFYNSIKVTECFVDPHKNQIRCYKAGTMETSCWPEQGSLKDVVQLSIKQLVFLHYGGVEIKYDDLNGQNYEKLTKEQCDVARSIMSGKNKDEDYKIYEEFFFACNKEVKRKKKDSCLEHLKKVIEERKEVVCKMQQIFEAATGRKWNFNEEKNQIELLPFMDGRWLEMYFYNALLEVKKTLKETGIELQTAWSYKVERSNSNKNFELDVLALRGYELILFSISMAGTGSDEHLAKGKWFEAVYRTEQMAGEHGKAILVNFLRDKKGRKTLEEFAMDLKTFKRDVQIINREDLIDYNGLLETIEKIING